jgi:(p)ppGpp synthase/HD superfamily hydrolase
MKFSEFHRLVGSMDLIRPPHEELYAILVDELKVLNPTHTEEQWVRIAFILSYRGHLKAPHRAGGEAYIFHLIRVTVSLIRHQASLGIKDIRSIVVAILHDSVEDAHEGGTHPVVMAGKVFFHLDAGTLIDVSVITRRRGLGETREQFCARILETYQWRPLVVKLEDRPDNMDTLEWVKDHEKQRKKVLETELWFPRYRDRLLDLLEKEVALGRVGPAYLHLPALLYSDLMESVRREKLRLGMTTHAPT